MRGRWGMLALVAGLLVPRAAAAQQTDRVLAEALFREGRELMEASKVPEACAKFAESYRLDPALGTLLNLGLCHEKDGKTATAWAELTDAAAQAAAEKDDRESIARKHVAALASDLPKLDLAVAPEIAALPAIELKLDGHVIGQAAWTTDLPIDPGDHDLAAGADGKKPFSTKFVIPQGAGTTSVTVPPLVDVPKPVVTPPSPPVEPSHEGAGNAQRLVGYVLGAAGIAGLGVGFGFGLSAISLKGDRDLHCNASNLCDATGVAKDGSARDAATISTVAVIAGGALLAGGIALVLTAPKNHPITVGFSPRALVLGGAF